MRKSDKRDYTLIVLLVFLFVLFIVGFSSKALGNHNKENTLYLNETIGFSGAFCRDQVSAHKVLSLMQHGGDWQAEFARQDNSCGVGRMLVTPLSVVRKYEIGENMWTLVKIKDSFGSTIFLFTTLLVKIRGHDA